MDGATASRGSAAPTMSEDVALRPAPMGRANPLAILAALAITLGVTIYPHVLAGPQGAADHWAAMAAFWSMSAGYVSGVGFRPQRRIFRVLFSAWICLAALALAVARMAWLWG
jgi:predicted membrane protein